MEDQKAKLLLSGNDKYIFAGTFHIVFFPGITLQFFHITEKLICLVVNFFNCLPVMLFICGQYPDLLRHLILGDQIIPVKKYHPHGSKDEYEEVLGSKYACYSGENSLKKLRMNTHRTNIYSIIQDAKDFLK